MGLFGKKKDIPDGIRVMFYDGELSGFQCNFPCQLLLMDDVLRITRVKPDIEVKLDRNRVSSIDIFPELQYMTKYKGTSIETTKSKRVQKEYYVINYINKNGEYKHLDFWGTASETLKIMKMRQQLQNNSVPQLYDI